MYLKKNMIRNDMCTRVHCSTVSNTKTWKQPKRLSTEEWIKTGHVYACVCAQSLQSCLTLCNPLDCSPPGSCVLGFSKQGYWSGLPSPPPEDLPNSGIEPRSLMSPALADGFFTTSATWEAHMYVYIHVFLFFTTVFNPENSFWNISSFLQLNI